MTPTLTNETEVEGTIIHVIHVDDSDTEPERTVLALVDRDGMSMSIDEEEGEFNPAVKRRTQRYRTNNTADLEVSSVMAVDLESMELIGLVDTDGRLTFDTDSRRLRPSDDEYIEIAYGNAEGFDFADAELVHRFEDIEATSPEVNMGDVPPLVSWTFMIHGEIWWNYEEAV